MKTHLNVIVVKIHENPAWIICPTWFIDFSMTMRPFESNHATRATLLRHISIHLKVLLDEGKWQINLAPLFFTRNYVFCIYVTFNILKWIS